MLWRTKGISELTNAFIIGADVGDDLSEDIPEHVITIRGKPSYALKRLHLHLLLTYPNQFSSSYTLAALKRDIREGYITAYQQVELVNISMSTPAGWFKSVLEKLEATGLKAALGKWRGKTYC